MIGRILFESADWKLTASLLGRYKVSLKARGLSRKASKQEGHHFLRMLECMADVGIAIEPGSEIYETAAEAFCSAVFGAGDARWQAYFNMAPHVWAELYAEEIQAK